jgi:glycosyltransferase involved in cell wall biosynthesis
MKVVIVHNRYGSTARGGAEAVAASQATELVAAGHEVAVVTCAGHAAGFRQGEGNVWTYSPPNLSSFLFLGSLSYPLRFLWHMIDTLSPLPAADWQDWLSSNKPDLIITHNLKGLGLTAARVFSSGPWQWEHICHDVQLLLPSGLLMYAQESALDYMSSRIYQAICRKLFSKAQKVSFPSQWLLDLHKSRGFFPNAELIKTGPTLVAPEPRARKPGEPLKLLFAGQVAEHKGINWLIRNWRKVRESLGVKRKTL